MFSGEGNFKTELSFQEVIVYLKKTSKSRKKRIQLKLLLLKNRDLSKLMNNIDQRKSGKVMIQV